MKNVTHLRVTLMAGVLVTAAACTVPAEQDDATESVSGALASRFDRDGQQAWFHDEGDSFGFFHTYDAFSACGGKRKIHVLVPRDYEANNDRYPVIYMNDGNTSFWRGGIGNRTWGVQKTLGDLGGAIERPIVVAIEPRDREAEYTYASWAGPVRPCCGLPDYAREVATCLKPWMDAHYRTRPAAASTGIVGSSHGGLAAYWMASRYPATFGFAAAMSPSFWAGLGGSRVRDSELVAPVRGALGARPRPSFWIDWGLRRSNGSSDNVVEALATDTAKEMVAALKELGYGSSELATLEDPVGGHDEDAWAYRFGEFVKWRLGRGR